MITKGMTETQQQRKKNLQGELCQHAEEGKSKPNFLQFRKICADGKSKNAKIQKNG